MKTRDSNNEGAMGLVRKSLWNLNLAAKGNTLANLRQLTQWQWLDQSELTALQQERLVQLLRHAYSHVPYYRKLLGNNRVVDERSVVLLSNFTKIPLLDRANIRDHFDELKSDDLGSRRWFYNTSGGSTGEPVKFIQDGYYADWCFALKNLDDMWTGYSVGNGQVLLWGSEDDLFVGRESYKIRLMRWLRNELCLNAFRMTPERMFAYVDKINTFKPVRIFAYANSIYELSRFIECKGLKVHNPKVIKTTAGNLHKDMRRIIERIFDAPIFDCYGSREVSDIACECDKHRGLHVFSPIHYLEILTPDGSEAAPGKTGEIVITLLTNFAMPLIRYRIGDIGAWADGPCSCGRSLPLLKKVAGRLTDVFIRKDGGVVLPEYLIHLIGVVLNTGWIRKYQVIQEDYDLIRILLISQNGSSEVGTYLHELREISDKICLVMGEDCNVKFDFVEDLPLTPSGKFRYTTSNVKRS